MRIEDLVPPMKLCKLIPKGKFADSALVWCEDEDGLELVMLREIAEFEKEDIFGGGLLLAERAAAERAAAERAAAERVPLSDRELQIQKMIK